MCRQTRIQTESRFITINLQCGRKSNVSRVWIEREGSGKGINVERSNRRTYTARKKGEEGRIRVIIYNGDTTTASTRTKHHPIGGKSGRENILIRL